MAEDRVEIGAYLQDEIFFDRFRLVLGGRVDKFGNLSKPVFSPRLSFIVKPDEDHSVTLSYNRAFRSPSTINNFLLMSIVQPVDLSGLAAFRPLLPALLPPGLPLDGRARRAAAASAAARPDDCPTVSAGGQRGRQRRSGRHAAAGRAHRRVADGVRAELHRGVRRRDDRRSRRLPESARHAHQLRAAARQRGSVHGGEPAAGLGASAAGADVHGRAGDLSAADGVHLPQPRSDAAGRAGVLGGPADLAIDVGVVQLLLAGRAGNTGLTEPVPPGGAHPPRRRTGSTSARRWTGRGTSETCP